MRIFLRVKPLLECCKQPVELFRLDDGPRYYIQLPAMKARDEVGVLFLLDDPLELERKSMEPQLAEWLYMYYEKPHSRLSSLWSDSTTS